MSDFNELSAAYQQAVMAVDRVGAERVLRDGIERGFDPVELADGVVSMALSKIGDQWEAGEAALSQVFMAGRISEDLIEKVFPVDALEHKEDPTIGLAVLDDYHLLGKRMVLSILRAAGHQPLDYGRVTVDELVNKVTSDGVQVLMISTLMLRSALQVRNVRDALEAKGVSVNILVGGAPYRFDQELWKEVGADAMADTASGALSYLENVEIEGGGHG